MSANSTSNFRPVIAADQNADTASARFSRLEDDRLLRGAGRFLANLRLDGMLHAAIVRAQHAHARLKEVAIGEAAAMPGVVGVFAGPDLVAAGLRPLPCVRPITSVDGRPFQPPARYALALETVRYVGEPVAMVIAETPMAALDAAEAVLVDYEALPVVVDPAAREDIAFVWEKGDRAGVDLAFARADKVVEIRVINNRVFMSPIEPRGAVGVFEADSGRYVLYTPTQGAHLIRRLVAPTLGVEESQLRVVTHDVGGSFGLKLVNSPEQTLVLFAARKLDRPVRWIATRQESYLSDNAGRDHVSHAAAAFDGEGRMLALRADTIANLGAYASALGPTTHTAGFAATFGGGYAVPFIHVRSTGVYTNMAPTDAFRGSGKPESLYLTERLMDKAARQLKMDRLELRQRNLVQPEAMPYRAASGYLFDSGDFPAVLGKAASLAGWRDFAARRAKSSARGRRRGIGASVYIHATGVTSSEISRVAVNPAGWVVVQTGTQSSGQGHETTFAELVAQRLGIDSREIRVQQGDTGELPLSGGPSAGSSSLQVGGVTIVRAMQRMLDGARDQAAMQLEAASADLEYGAGRFTIRGTDRSIGLYELAGALKKQGLPDCAGEASLEGDILTIPNGAYIAEVEVDGETGHVELLRFCGVDDLGRRLNPVVAEGQLHGALAQGIGQALLERVVYDRDTGQLLTGSLMDYGLPRAHDLCAFELHAADIPTMNNPLGMKGVAEVGCIGAPAAIMNAIVDALDGRDLDMPATPESVWRALNGGK
jgi:carbon-monoxide dehydrogenase large subunit